MENLQKILSEIIADFIPDFISIEDISRLSGGSSNESWKITLNTRENKKLHVGNINKNTFEEIWSSEKISDLEKCINASNCNTFCKSLKLNNLVHSIKCPSQDYSENFF